jgi:BON domain
LRGAVPSYYLKQIAQELVRDLDGVLLVNNQIKVARPSTNKTR